MNFAGLLRNVLRKSRLRLIAPTKTDFHAISLDGVFGGSQPIKLENAVRNRKVVAFAAAESNLTEIVEGLTHSSETLLFARDTPGKAVLDLAAERGVEIRRHCKAERIMRLLAKDDDLHLLLFLRPHHLKRTAFIDRDIPYFDRIFVCAGFDRIRPTIEAALAIATEKGIVAHINELRINGLYPCAFAITEDDGCWTVGDPLPYSKIRQMVEGRDGILVSPETQNLTAALETVEGMETLQVAMWHESPRGEIIAPGRRKLHIGTDVAAVYTKADKRATKAAADAARLVISALHLPDRYDDLRPILHIALEDDLFRATRAKEIAERLTASVPEYLFIRSSGLNRAYPVDADTH